MNRDFAQSFNIAAHINILRQNKAETLYVLPAGGISRYVKLRQHSWKCSGSSCRLPSLLRHKIKLHQPSSLRVPVQTCQTELVSEILYICLRFKTTCKGTQSRLDSGIFTGSCLGLDGIFGQDRWGLCQHRNNRIITENASLFFFCLFSIKQ